MGLAAVGEHSHSYSLSLLFGWKGCGLRSPTWRSLHYERGLVLTRDDIVALRRRILIPFQFIGGSWRC
jgi:hypothetical protein